MFQLFFVALYSALPVVEMRFAIPIGILHFDLPVEQVFITAMITNFIATYSVYLLLPSMVMFFQKHSPLFDRIMNKIFAKTHRKFSRRMTIWGDIFLIILVAVPLPGSGGWTGALLAYLFEFNRKNTALCLGVGGFISAIIITMITLGGENLYQKFI